MFHFGNKIHHAQRHAIKRGVAQSFDMLRHFIITAKQHVGAKPGDQTFLEVLDIVIAPFSAFSLMAAAESAASQSPCS